jgi:hypothetical protein
VGEGIAASSENVRPCGVFVRTESSGAEDSITCRELAGTGGPDVLKPTTWDLSSDPSSPLRADPKPFPQESNVCRFAHLANYSITH